MLRGVRLLQQRELVVLFLDFCDGMFILLAKGAMLVALDANSRGLNVAMVRTLLLIWIENAKFFFVVVILHKMPIIHVLVVCFNSIHITKGRVHLLLDYLAHAGLQFFILGIQKVYLGLNLLLRKSTHCDELLEEPFVSLTQVALLHIYISLVYYMDHELS